MKKRIRSTLSIVLTLVLIVGMMPLSIYAGTSKYRKNYLFIGDSMTYNFVNGRHYYTKELDINGHYPVQVAGKMGYTILNESETNREALTNGGVRTTDIYAFLSDSFAEVRHHIK